jgi:hypothetical protein
MSHGESNPLNGAARLRPLHLVLDPLAAVDDAGDDYDALRDLFLSGSTLSPAPSKPAKLEATAPAETEGLVLGHLPVFGPAWVGQYARSVAEEIGGAVGLVRIRAGQATVDVFGEAASGLTEVATLEEAVSAAAPVVGRWLFRLDEMDEPQMAESSRLARITLLTGVDETAMVACYGTLKRLVRQDQDGAPTGPAVRLAIMGSAQDKAGPAAEKLARAAEMFLGRKVEISACQSRISPGKSVCVFRGAVSAGLDGLLDLIAEAPRTAVKRPGARRVPEAAVPIAETAVAEASPPARVPAPTPAEQVVVATPMAAPARVVTSGEGASIASRIGGLVPLRARCPHASRVELAADSSGVLHLVAQAEDGMAGEDRALAELTACAAWAGAHLQLIALTAPEARLLTAGARPVIHLATRHAPSVRRLLDTDLRLHLVVSVAVGGREEWVCVSLN